MLPHSNKREQKLIASKISLQYHHILQHRPSTILEQTWMRRHMIASRCAHAQITLKKSHTQRSWGTPQNFCLVFIDELEKQLLIKINVEVGQ